LDKWGISILRKGFFCPALLIETAFSHGNIQIQVKKNKEIAAGKEIFPLAIIAD